MLGLQQVESKQGHPVHGESGFEDARIQKDMPFLGAKKHLHELPGRVESEEPAEGVWRRVG